MATPTMLALAAEYDKLDGEQENILNCLYVLDRYFKGLKIQRTINEIGLDEKISTNEIAENIPKIIEFCKKGKWNNLVENLETDDAESLEMLILEKIYRDSLEYRHIAFNVDKTTSNIIFTFTL